MQRFLVILSASFLLTACEDFSDDYDSADIFEDTGHEMVAESKPAKKSMKAVDSDSYGVATRFSWESRSAAKSARGASADVVAVEPPKESDKAIVIGIREADGLVSLARSEKPELYTRLQLVKEGKLLLVEVISVSDTQIVANILPNQMKSAHLMAGDLVTCNVVTSKPPTE
jgi:hypothetical protein